MRKQQIPPVDDAASLDAIVNAKQGTRKIRLQNVKDNIYQAYVDFIEKSNNLGVMTPITLGKIQKKDMEHCYSSNTAGLSSLKAAIKESHNPIDRELCPYCGVREPSEFDHYLPKSRFQEFSVFSKNLIWACHRCNHRKKEHFVANDRYLNTYFDVIPEEQFLFCTVGVPLEEQGISFYFNKPDSITVSQYDTIVSHARKLEILESYKQRASQRVPGWFQKWKILAENYDIEGLTNHLRLDIGAEIRIDENKYGKNYFNSVLLRGVLSQIDDIVGLFYT